MDTKQFLSAVLSDKGFYCAVGIKNGHVTHRFYQTVDNLMDGAIAFDEVGQDAYFALATFATKENRKAKNVECIKTLFLDLDCGEGKSYATQHEAIKALQEFCRALKVPKPSIIVNSGFGVHTYWVLDRSYTRDEWLPVADRFKSACLQMKLHIDPAVPADAARILRVPTTHNYKGSPPITVEIFRSNDCSYKLQDIADLLPETLIPVVNVREYSAEDKQDLQAVLGNYTKSFRRLVERTLNGSGCAQIKRAIETPNALGYPEWLHALSIAKHCEEGSKAVHLISKGYDNYNAVETDKIAASITAPHLCMTFEKDYPAGCEGCPHKGKIKSPIKLCMMVKEAPPEDHFEDEEDIQVTHTAAPQFEAVEDLPDDDGAPRKLNTAPVTSTRVSIPPYPAPYFRGVNGGVFLRVRDKDGNPEEVKIHDTDLYIVKRLSDPGLGPCYVFRHHTRREGVQEFTISGTKLAARESFRTEMGLNDVFLLKPDLLMAYVERWVHHAQASMPVVQVKTQFGWTTNQQSFVIGGREVFANRVEPNPPSARTQQYFHIFQQRGNVDGWKRIAQFFNRPKFEEHQYMFALSFGAPLMIFAPSSIPGSIFHLKSADSGHGKTTGQLGGASVWGHPKSYLLSGADTTNSVWNRTEIYKNMVVYVDELSNHEAKELSDFAYAVVDGRQRNRMSNMGQNMERVRGDLWATLVGTSGNQSFLEKITEYRATPKGEAQRVLEEQARPLPQSPDMVNQGKDLYLLFEQHYGIVGDMYIQYILQNRTEVETLLNKIWDDINKLAGLTPQNRYFAWQAATTITGALIFKKMELISWDLRNLRDWIVQKLKDARVEIKALDTDVADVIGQYYADNVRGILRIHGDDGKFADENNNMFVNADAMPINKWVGRHEFNNSKLYLLPKPFKTWCTKQQLDYGALMEKLRVQYGAKTVKIRMGRGTKINLPVQHAIEIAWDDGTPNDSAIAPDVVV